MLPKENRLTKLDFTQLAKDRTKRKPYRGPFFDVFLYENKDIYKVACVISKKRVKKAVNRNKIKRIIYHAFKISLKNKEINKVNNLEKSTNYNYFYIFYPKTDVLINDFDKIIIEMNSFFDTID